MYIDVITMSEFVKAFDDGRVREGTILLHLIHSTWSMYYKLSWFQYLAVVLRAVFVLWKASRTILVHLISHQLRRDWRQSSAMRWMTCTECVWKKKTGRFMCDDCFPIIVFELNLTGSFNRTESNKVRNKQIRHTWHKKAYITYVVYQWLSFY